MQYFFPSQTQVNSTTRAGLTRQMNNFFEDAMRTANSNGYQLAIVFDGHTLRSNETDINVVSNHNYCSIVPSDGSVEVYIQQENGTLLRAE